MTRRSAHRALALGHDRPGLANSAGIRRELINLARVPAERIQIVHNFINLGLGTIAEMPNLYPAADAPVLPSLYEACRTPSWKATPAAC